MTSEMIQVETLPHLLWLLQQIVQFAKTLPEDSTDDLRERLELFETPAKQAIRHLKKEGIEAEIPSLIDRDQIALSVEQVVRATLESSLPEHLTAKLASEAFSVDASEAERAKLEQQRKELDNYRDNLDARAKSLEEQISSFRSRASELDERERAVCERENAAPVTIKLTPDDESVIQLVDEIERTFRRKESELEDYLAALKKWDGKARAQLAGGIVPDPMPEDERQEEVFPSRSDGITLDEVSTLTLMVRRGQPAFSQLPKQIKRWVRDSEGLPTIDSVNDGLSWDELLGEVERSDNGDHLFKRLGILVATRRRAQN